MKNNELLKLSIGYLTKKLGYTKFEAIEQGIPLENRKAPIIMDKKTINIFPTGHPDSIPMIQIRNPDALEKILEEYLQTVKNINIKYTHYDSTHQDKYFLYNIWKNATQSDCIFPEQFVRRYINFIKDTTFSEYDELTTLGKIDKNILMIKRQQDLIGFETPYVIHLFFTDGIHIYNLPWIRYGISANKNGEKVAYIYALQQMEDSPCEEYNTQIKQILNSINKGIKKYRNVTPSAIASLSIFLGILESHGIYKIEAPDFLILRYAKYKHSGLYSINEQDRIQKNLTDKFLRNFLRLSEQLGNLKINSIPDGELNSFLCMTLNPYKETCNNHTLENLYKLGLGKDKSSLVSCKGDYEK